jgi:tRNA wybutosine-synthesizing protein 3
MNFLSRKENIEQDILNNDKSPKGSVDEKAKPIVNLINNSTKYFTTSSCSGRISVFSDVSDPEKKKKKKKGGSWLYVSHNSIDRINDYNSVLRECCVEDCDVTNTNRFVYFKFEPFILHVDCVSLEDAERLSSTAIQCGYRNSGIVTSNRQMVAIRSTLKLDAPIAVICDQHSKPHPIVSIDYINILIDICREKFIINENRMDILYNGIQKLLNKLESNIG